MKKGTKKALAMLMLLVLAIGLACSAAAEKTVSSPVFTLPQVFHRPTPEPVAEPEEPDEEPTAEPTAEPTTTPEPTATPEPAIGTFVTEAEATDIRLASDGMSEILLTVPANTTLEVLAAKEDDAAHWTRVRFGETIGYIYTRAEEEKSEQEPGEEQPDEPKEKPEMEVLIFTSQRAVLNMGDPITLTSELYGFDGYEIMYQWQCDQGNGFEDIPGANEPSYTFEANEETLKCSWMLEVYYR